MSASLSFAFLAGLLPLAAALFWITRNKAQQWQRSGSVACQPGYYGWQPVLGMAIPALGMAMLLGLLHALSSIHLPIWIHLGLLLFAAAGGATLALRSLSPGHNARHSVERLTHLLMAAATTVSILTTLGIVLSVLFEAMRFFDSVPLFDFLTGTHWSPDSAFLAGAGRADEASGATFGAIPIFAGTLMITCIAMLVAIPTGLFSAIYLSEFASQRLRLVCKPMLEILAGIPTVVYGFFAAITFSPFIVSLGASVGLEVEYTNALSCGIIMGVMIIPFVSSLSDDVIHAVPQSLRDGSMALGMMPAETIRHVVLPAAMPGIISACLIAISRAIGETMIVVMAAGLRPNLTANPLEGVTTVTVKIVESLTGDQEFDSLLTLSAFALGLVLLVITLILNMVSSITIQRFKRRYAQL